MVVAGTVMYNLNFNKFKGSSRHSDGGRDHEFSSQKKVNNNKDDDRSSKIATANYDKSKLFKIKNNERSVVETNTSSRIVSSDAIKHQAPILVVPKPTPYNFVPRCYPTSSAR